MNRTPINGEMAQAILDAVGEHALLRFCRPLRHDKDLCDLSAALAPAKKSRVFLFSNRFALSN